eukprot:scaffold65366_cov68-Phaeocystis_antarctica.AAC.2
MKKHGRMYAYLGARARAGVLFLLPLCLCKRPAGVRVTRSSVVFYGVIIPSRRRGDSRSSACTVTLFTNGWAASYRDSPVP